ncbi:hypothetical protein A9Q95_07660 [Rhodobacterales bacterium 59_46_T64]|nr:hypothetical protein A9Q95_07660 [Rhodobacterales bacterium 59_46_T64]
MYTPDGGPGWALLGLHATLAPIALDLGSHSSPLLAPIIAAGWTLVFSVCPRFDLGDRCHLSPEIPDLCLGILDLGRVQPVEINEEAAEIMM